MNKRAFAAIILALLVPGAGHLYLGRRRRALAFFAIIGCLFVVGLLAGGDLYTLLDSRGALLPRLASYASMGSGVFYAIGKVTGPHGSVTSATFEYGRLFTLTAGVMNLLLLLDCYDIGIGRKPS